MRRFGDWNCDSMGLLAVVLLSVNIYVSGMHIPAVHCVQPCVTDPAAAHT
jgi:hypothetical protein